MFWYWINWIYESVNSTPVKRKYSGGQYMKHDIFHTVFIPNYGKTND